MIEIYCNRCKEKIGDYETYLRIRYGWWHQDQEYQAPKDSHYPYCEDICSDCAKKMEIKE